MKRWNNVAIVGVGLIGGSIGLALLERGLARTVVGIGRRQASLQKARQRGAVTTTTTSLAHGVAEAELIVVCTPVSQIVEHSLEAAEHCPQGALITDVGSTKGSIVAEMDRRLNGSADRRAAFIGSHPLAGSEKTGPEHAGADLFEGRVVVVTPSGETLASDRDCIEAFWKGFDAVVIRQTPEEHDRAVAAISHLPHLVASALSAATSPEDLPLAGGGWRDTTRVAAGDVELWRQILTDNRAHILESLDKFEKELGTLRRALQTGNQAELIQLLEAGKRNRDAVGN